MSFLDDHFARVNSLKDAAIPVTEGLYIDIGGTLIQNGLNEALWTFALWNHEKKFLGPNYFFTGNLSESIEQLEKYGINLSMASSEELLAKQSAYKEAFSAHHQDNLKLLKGAGKEAFKPRPSFKLATVIDDGPALEKTVIDGEPLTVTHWNPRDAEFRSFLVSEDYKNFSPPNFD